MTMQRYNLRNFVVSLQKYFFVWDTNTVVMTVWLN